MNYGKISAQLTLWPSSAKILPMPWNHKAVRVGVVDIARVNVGWDTCAGHIDFMFLDCIRTAKILPTPGNHKAVRVGVVDIARVAVGWDTCAGHIDFIRLLIARHPDSMGKANVNGSALKCVFELFTKEFFSDRSWINSSSTEVRFVMELFGRSTSSGSSGTVVDTSGAVLVTIFTGSVLSQCMLLLVLRTPTFR